MFMRRRVGATLYAASINAELADRFSRDFMRPQFRNRPARQGETALSRAPARDPATRVSYVRKNTYSIAI